MNDSIALPGHLSQYGRHVYMLTSVNNGNLRRSYIEVDFVNKTIQFYVCEAQHAITRKSN